MASRLGSLYPRHDNRRAARERRPMALTVKPWGDDSGAYQFSPCPFCGSEIHHIESWARSFDPPRLWHEWHHADDSDCWVVQHRGKIVALADDKLENQELAMRSW